MWQAGGAEVPFAAMSRASWGGLLPPTTLNCVFSGRKRSMEWVFPVKAQGHPRKSTLQGGVVAPLT